jgi:hypothetical protein
LDIEIGLLLNQTNKQFFIICPVKENYFSKTSKFISRYYSKYYNSILLNKDLVLSGIAGFLTNAIVIHLADLYSKNNFANSALTVLTGYIVSKMVFAFLFQKSYHKLYTNSSTGKIEWTVLKQIIKKMMLATFIFDLIDNGTKFIFIFEFLHLGFLPLQTVIISTIMSSTLSYLSINIVVKYTHVFRKENKS